MSESRISRFYRGSSTFSRDSTSTLVDCRDNFDDCFLNTKVYCRGSIDKPNINSVLISSIHTIIHGKDSVSVKRRDFNFSSKWQEVSSHHSIISMFSGSRDKRGTVSLV